MHFSCFVFMCTNFNIRRTLFTHRALPRSTWIYLVSNSATTTTRCRAVELFYYKTEPSSKAAGAALGKSAGSLLCQEGGTAAANRNVHLNRTANRCLLSYTYDGGTDAMRMHVCSSTHNWPLSSEPYRDLPRPSRSMGVRVFPFFKFLRRTSLRSNEFL